MSPGAEDCQGMTMPPDAPGGRRPWKHWLWDLVPAFFFAALLLCGTASSTGINGGVASFRSRLGLTDLWSQISHYFRDIFSWERPEGTSRFEKHDYSGGNQREIMEISTKRRNMGIQEGDMLA